MGDGITPAQIRHALKVHGLGPRGTADLLAPGLPPDERIRLAGRIKALAVRDRRKARAAGKLLEIPREDEARPGPPVDFTPEPIEPLEDPDDLPREDFLRHRIRQIESDITSARGRGHTNALTNLMREQRACVTELDELTRTEQAGDEFEGLDGDALVAPICDALRDPDFPETIAEQIADALYDRYGGNIVPFKARP